MFLYLITNNWNETWIRTATGEYQIYLVTFVKEFVDQDDIN
jgi:hypothetical protein